jgi:hypothetical protein
VKLGGVKGCQGGACRPQNKNTNMNGSIEFKDSASLAYFLSHFSGCSATFKVTQEDDKLTLTVYHDQFTMTFTGSRQQTVAA